ncbi:DNA polymerase III subunit gamma/tau [Vibrio mediterranei]|uniref:DNA polymerase III subunit gamma/tau n=1 Tax=Vibrio mediterranei TaxID=689 RepID=UPI001EFE815F|nr:DNA polymerase III subunit gamma/tau [Vibrio mediterranei]MCG9624941.1 DNA polymerase III subunit gamma/tau [Vibrio mediterranei]
MSYLALARKWRPRKFSEVVGQTHVLTALENALDQNRLHHAYLFSGTRGVGKTSIGRLFAKGLNCETGITSTPCGTCSTCIEIDEGRSVDLLEIDAASRTKVEDTRELLDNVQYKPARNRFKVYLIDEVHMLSRHSFNALLKTLEEPPEYVKFLLATTDPQKLPMTILSRCLQFHLKPITVENIQQQLDHILEKEQVQSESRALALLAHAADGSMRDALSLTDQAIALGNGNVSTPVVSQMLGTLDTAQAIQILESLTTGDAHQVMTKLEHLAENGVDWDTLLSELALQLHRIAMAQALPSSIDAAIADSEKIQHLARVLQATDVQLYYQIALKGRQDLPFAPSQRVAVEMTLLRMLAFRPSTQLSANEITVANQSAVTKPALSSSQSMATQQVSSDTNAQTYATPTPQFDSTREAYIDTSTMPMGNQPAQAEHRPSAQSEWQAPPSSQEQCSQTSPAQIQLTPSTGANDAVRGEVQRSAPASEPARPAGGLRHQLRSKRQSASQGQANSGSSPVKKPKASSESASVLERVAQRTQGRTPSASNGLDAAKSNTEQVKDNEPYRWRPTGNVVAQEVKPVVKPSTLKKALEHIKTPEMAQRLTQEAAQQDTWAELIERLDIGKLVQQLALNSVFKKDGSSIQLGLRATHAHLNSDKNQSELLAGLNVLLGEECHLSVELSEEGTTPLELREQLYQGKLSDAAKSLQADPNIQFIVTRFAAELDEESIRPL